MFDTHCHLNFKAFDGKVKPVIDAAREAGVNYLLVPGTDLETSKKAVDLANKYKNVYAAVGIHPHHIYKYQKSKGKSQNDKSNIKNDLKQIEELIISPKVVAIGEVGVDRHVYKKTNYRDYQVDKKLIALQKEIFLEQIKLASKYKKALIIHNRKANGDILEMLSNDQQLTINNKIVFHCCEPDEEILDFAKRHKIYLGVDGDVTYRKEKQEFSKRIPLSQLVLETDSPFLLPRPLKGEKNQPKNLSLITTFIADLLGISQDRLNQISEENGKKLFKLD